MSKKKNDIKQFNEHLTAYQKQVKKELLNLTVATLNGRAGTGKTSLAVNFAYEQLCLKNANKIVVTRATAMKKKHDLGFLKGSADEKMEPWMSPIYDSIHKLEPPTGDRDKVEELLKSKKLEIVPLAFVQGRTFDNAIVIVDEYQNLDSDDIQGVITRLGRGSRMIFSGDFRQSLISHSGVHLLNEACNKFKDMKTFTFEENFRHPIVEKMITFYEEKEKSQTYE